MKDLACHQGMIFSTEGGYGKMTSLLGWPLKKHKPEIQRLIYNRGALYSASRPVNSTSRETTGRREGECVWNTLLAGVPVVGTSLASSGVDFRSIVAIFLNENSLVWSHSSRMTVKTP
ncbi:hypothetical protein VTK56DRAFT_5926 [Thermocarpiscus australiensis]